LGQTTEFVTFLMESRGRGLRRGGKGGDKSSSSDAAAAAPPAEMADAWASFLEEEHDTSSSAKSKRSSSSKKDDAASKDSGGKAGDESSTSGDARVYELPLQPQWLKKSSARSKKKAKTEAPKTGLLVQSGTLDSALIGRHKRSMDKPYDLMGPTVLSTEIQAVKVISSCNACHAIVLDSDGKAYGWGRNDANQFGKSNSSTNFPSNVVMPTLLENTPDNVVFVDGAVGKHHCLLLTDEGKVYAVGSNKVGQCGVNLANLDHVNKWKPCVFADGDVTIVQVACGEAFSVALSAEGDIYTTGSSEFGQLGNGETGEYFVTASKLAFANCQLFVKRTDTVHTPFLGSGGGGDKKAHEKKEPLFANGVHTPIKYQHISCGKHHTVAVEAASNNKSYPARVVSWGCGNYGCLGHGVQADDYTPRLVQTLDNQNMFQNNPPVLATCGSNCSMVLTKQGHVYYWGKHRSVGEATMRPTLLAELAHNGHVVEHVGAGSQTVVCSTANAVTVAWGQGPHGELGLPGGKKSSSKPQFIPNLDKCRILDLACGYGTTYYVVLKEDAEDEAAIKALPVVDKKGIALLEAKNKAA